PPAVRARPAACAGAAPAPDGPLDCCPPRRHLRPVAAPPPAWPWPHRFPRTQTSASLLNWTGEHSCWPTLVQCELLTRSTVRAWQEVGVRAPWLLHVLHGTPACRRPALRSRLHPRAKQRHKRLQPRLDLQPPRRPIGRSRLKPLLQNSSTAALPCAVFATANHPPLPTATRLAASLPHAHRPPPLRPHPPVPARAARQHHPRLQPGAVRAAHQRAAAAARAGRLRAVLPPARAPQ